MAVGCRAIGALDCSMRPISPSSLFLLRFQCSEIPSWLLKLLNGRDEFEKRVLALVRHTSVQGSD
jgi:hypothetical protein